MLSHYSINRRPRGQCLIINIEHFDKGITHLHSRRGAKVDEGIAPFAIYTDGILYQRSISVCDVTQLNQWLYNKDYICYLN